jgi:hypothetical protein
MPQSITDILIAARCFRQEMRLGTRGRSPPVGVNLGGSIVEQLSQLFSDAPGSEQLGQLFYTVRYRLFPGRSLPGILTFSPPVGVNLGGSIVEQLSQLFSVAPGSEQLSQLFYTLRCQLLPVRSPAFSRAFICLALPQTLNAEIFTLSSIRHR